MRWISVLLALEIRMISGAGSEESKNLPAQVAEKSSNALGGRGESGFSGNFENVCNSIDLLVLGCFVWLNLS